MTRAPRCTAKRYAAAFRAGPCAGRKATERKPRRAWSVSVSSAAPGWDQSAGVASSATARSCHPGTARSGRCRGACGDAEKTIQREARRSGCGEVGSAGIGGTRDQSTVG
ncbi:unnamed protein product [Urochloa decumbens]|uniref:Uncharacterized protein n=1 Tax=Urochloa decumbens TaxID=240449 RepID=A0ABC9G0U8_9POAL